MANKKKTSTSKKFKLNGYSNFEFLVVIGNDELKRIFDVEFEELQRGLGGVLDAKDGNTYPVVAFKELRLMNAGVIAHECIHAAWYFVHMLGINASFDNQESLAYLSQYMVDCVTEVKEGLNNA